MKKLYLPVEWKGDRLVYNVNGIDHTVLYDRGEGKEKINKDIGLVEVGDEDKTS